MPRWLKRLLTPPLVMLAALLIFFEEWLWDRLTALTARLARLPPLQRLEARIARLPPYPAMIVLLLPATLLLPVKLAALALIVRGHALLGLGVIFGAKVLSTAFLAHLFDLCRPALLTVPWIRRFHDGFLRLRDRVYARLRALPGWQAALRLRTRIRTWRAGLRRGALTRLWAGIRRHAARRPRDAA